MQKQTITKNRVHTILTCFVIVNIIGDIGNVAFWWANPISQISLVGGTIDGVTSPGGILFNAVGAGNALAIGSAVLLGVAAVYIVALFGLFKRLKWAPLLVIAISVVNRALALLLYFISPAFAFWAVWTVILVALAYLDYSKILVSTPPPSSPQPKHKL